MQNSDTHLEHFTWKVVPVGDGSLYGWAKFNDAGEVVERSSNNWPAALDAEKEMRTLAPKTDTVEVDGVRNINPDSNTNVEVVKPKSEIADRFAGATPVEKGIEERAADAAEAERSDEDKELEQENQTPAAPETTEPQPGSGDDQNQGAGFGGASA